ncbi:spore germination protein GerPE [Bacillus sp. V5-8f]|uniref:spore germination protein GerPE n=1 Tax=Bacillus sp. V5-8f TaxID=2053044 RepID=UPI000C759BA0|nr:spore germination protein GerPE [Bacillus sp. V5-8f]PLT33828.1 spore germination protein GerPE [Bacillus sp. V5-8f]
MFSRISKVDSVSIKSLDLSSTIQIGDCSYIHSIANVFAVQRQIPTYLGNEADVLPYEIYSYPDFFLPITEQVTTTYVNKQPFINVGEIDIKGIAASSVVMLGNTGDTLMHARIKHIRQLLNGSRPIPYETPSTSIQTTGSQPFD